MAKPPVKSALAVVQYKRSEGCGCCQSSKHEDHQDALGKAIGAPMYDDGSGYDFNKAIPLPGEESE